MVWLHSACTQLCKCAPNKTYKDMKVGTNVKTRSRCLQVSPDVGCASSQTTAPVALLSELQPPCLEEEGSPADRIKMAVQYTIQVGTCVHVCILRGGAWLPFRAYNFFFKFPISKLKYAFSSSLKGLSNDVFRLEFLDWSTSSMSYFGSYL